MTLVKLFLALLSAIVIAGCSSIDTLNRVSTPNELFVLTPKSTFSSNLPKIQSQIIVNEPTATAAVNTDQIAVFPTALQVQYLPRVRWVERAPLIVQALLIESFENTGKVPAVGRSAVSLRADYSIATDIREFQAELIPATETTPESMRVNVRLNIKIIDEFEDKIIASKSFEKKVLPETEEPTDIAEAFDQALGSAMRNAVEWSIQRIANHSY